MIIVRIRESAADAPRDPSRHLLGRTAYGGDAGLGRAFDGLSHRDPLQRSDLKVASLCEATSDAVTVVGSDAAAIGSFDSTRVLCPAGMTAIGGAGQRLIFMPDGTQLAPIGWQAGARNESSAQGDLKAAVICVPEPEASLLAACAVATLITVRRLRATRV